MTNTPFAQRLLNRFRPNRATAVPFPQTSRDTLRPEHAVLRGSDTIVEGEWDELGLPNLGIPTDGFPDLENPFGGRIRRRRLSPTQQQEFENLYQGSRLPAEYWEGYYRNGLAAEQAETKEERAETDLILARHRDEGQNAKEAAARLNNARRKIAPHTARPTSVRFTPGAENQTLESETPRKPTHLAPNTVQTSRNLPLHRSQPVSTEVAAGINPQIGDPNTTFERESRITDSGIEKRGTADTEKQTHVDQKKPPQDSSQEKRITVKTEEELSEKEIYREFDFNPEGPGDFVHFFRNPFMANDIDKQATNAQNVTAKHYPHVIPHNNEADAFRHAYWSYEMALKYGLEMAKEIGDGHEITGENPLSERAMDLFNNRVGRELALDPNNKGQGAEDVIIKAIKDGKLRLKPFNTGSTQGQQGY